jgi:phosphonoacetaldehyde hydrolase
MQCNLVRCQPKLVVFDLDGTLVDPGCQAPVLALLETFAQHRLMLTTAQVRAVVGLVNYEQVRTLLEMPAVGEQFQFVHGRRWNEADAMLLFHDLPAKQIAAYGRHGEIAAEAAECIAELQRRELAIGTTSNLPREVAELLEEALGIEGCGADAGASVDDVPSGRPAPWMIFRLLQQLDVFPPSAVVKVGRAPASAEEAAHAGCWSVTIGGDEAASLADVPAALDQIAARIAAGERP